MKKKYKVIIDVWMYYVVYFIVGFCFLIGLSAVVCGCIDLIKNFNYMDFYEAVKSYIKTGYFKINIKWIAHAELLTIWGAIISILSIITYIHGIHNNEYIKYQITLYERI